MKSSGNPAAASRTRVLIVEDHASIREMLAEVVGSMPEFEVVAGAGDVDEALRIARKVVPDVVILDWLFPGGGGAAFLSGLRSHRIKSHVLVLSAGVGDEPIREALTSGARGYVEKTANLSELIQALRVVAAGGAYFGPVAAGVVERLLQQPDRTRAVRAPVVAVVASPEPVKADCASAV